MKKITLFSLLIACCLLQFSCSKDGPAGPQGQTGPAGPAGPQGPAGAANVIYSPWFLTGSGWDTTGAITYGAAAFFNKAAAGVTQTVIDNGIVMAFMKGDPTTGLTNDVFPLPYSVGVGFGFTDLWDFDLNAPGNILFLYKSDFPWTPTELGAISFRYVIIPGGVAGGRMLDPRKMTYAELCQAYGIPQ
ncbi:MAG TPA: hypothetical protein VK588_08250 [Chitinophagaceae bacterium]|nr:hypothetical protein [Chitinophagaceae bacterium]